MTLGTVVTTQPGSHKRSFSRAARANPVFRLMEPPGIRCAHYWKWALKGTSSAAQQTQSSIISWRSGLPATSMFIREIASCGMYEGLPVEDSQPGTLATFCRRAARLRKSLSFP